MTIAEFRKMETQLVGERKILKDYLLAKFYAEDFHGVQDAASDLRDIDNQLLVLGKVLGENAISEKAGVFQVQSETDGA